MAQIQTKSRGWAKNLKFLVGVLIIVGAIAFLIFQSTKSTAVYYVTPSELKANSIYGEGVRVSGQLIKESIRWEPKTLTLHFNMTDGKETLPVVYQGPIPDTFETGTDVVAEGKYAREGVFQASTLLVKCPSKYQSQPTGSGGP
jgi:cytochrome c-type biogenesis protein CcmE